MMATPEPKSNAPTPATGVDDVKKLKEELRQRDEAVADLTQKVSDLQSTIISPQYQEWQKAQNQPAPQTFQPTEFAAGRTGEVDVEMLDNKQLAQHIVETVNKSILPRIEQNARNLQQYQLQGGIKEAKGKYKDFDNHQQAMGKLAARLEAGQITAEDVYKLASWTPPVETGAEDKDKGTIASEKPTTGVGAPTDMKKLTLVEKANKLWDEKGIDEKHPRAQD